MSAWEVTSVQIFDGLKKSHPARPYALASVMLGISMLLYLDAEFGA